MAATTITALAAAIYAATSPAPSDEALIDVCADDAGGSVPGTVLGSVSVPAVDPLVSPTTTPEQPAPVVTLNEGDLFWVVYGRTGALSDTEYYQAVLGAGVGGYYWTPDGATWNNSPGGNGSGLSITFSNHGHIDFDDGGVRAPYGETGAGGTAQKVAFKLTVPGPAAGARFIRHP